MSEPLRLQVYLARAGVASRRKCEALITAGKVRVNGQPATELGTKIDPARDAVTVDGRPVAVEAPVYLLLHKPRGYVTTASDPDGRPTVLDLVRKPLGDARKIAIPAERLFPVGRLDFNTDGVLVLTNDGELANALMHPRHGVPKTYHAKLQGAVDEAALERLRRGVTLDDGSVTAPAEVRVLESDSKHTWLEVTIREGKNRQVRRMADAIGHMAVKLTRVRYGSLTVEGLLPGRFRPLLPRELASLIALTRGTQKANPATKTHKSRSAEKDNRAPSTNKPHAAARRPRR